MTSNQLWGNLKVFCDQIRSGSYDEIYQIVLWYLQVHLKNRCLQKTHANLKMLKVQQSSIIHGTDPSLWIWIFESENGTIWATWYHKIQWSTWPWPILDSGVGLHTLIISKLNIPLQCPPRKHHKDLFNTKIKNCQPSTQRSQSLCCMSYTITGYNCLLRILSRPYCRHPGISG